MASRGGRGHSEALQHVQRMRDSGHDEASIRRALRHDGPGGYSASRMSQLLSQTRASSAAGASPPP
eukprot:12939647-Heterocapsa_arctica.AAC.1